jgi:hypothetical protein
MPSSMQRELIESARRESVLDKVIPLGMEVNNTKTLAGPSAAQYYRAKHARGEVGKYWLHQLDMHHRRGS